MGRRGTKGAGDVCVNSGEHIIGLGPGAPQRFPLFHVSQRPSPATASTGMPASRGGMQSQSRGSHLGSQPTIAIGETICHNACEQLVAGSIGGGAHQDARLGLHGWRPHTHTHEAAAAQAGTTCACTGQPGEPRPAIQQTSSPFSSQGVHGMRRCCAWLAAPASLSGPAWTACCWSPPAATGHT